MFQVQGISHGNIYIKNPFFWTKIAKGKKKKKNSGKNEESDNSVTYEKNTTNADRIIFFVPLLHGIAQTHAKHIHIVKKTLEMGNA